VNKGTNNLYVLLVQVAQPMCLQPAATTMPSGGTSTLGTSTLRP
jgi:hypothetical protein